ncbi:MAG TPA: ATP-binding protein [Candidatus Binatia bacterium]|nr:ATP-binding protein [Candidatus Binatia bacterium]
MVGMRLGGIDPSILRELSGVYKPFTKAFKELISNAFDADAESVRVGFADDFSSVTVTDDGTGMTPFEFHNDFTRIGGGSRRWAGDKTRKGRLRIGSKGIGFLALARYCDRLQVQSYADRTFQYQMERSETPVIFDLPSILGVPIDHILLHRFLSCEVRRSGPRGEKLEEGRHYTWKRKRSQLAIHEDVGAVTLKVRVDCKHLGFKAVLDFDQLLRLADNADLEKLEDFASIEVYEIDEQSPPPGTRVTAEQLKSFVRRELRMERRKGFVRNISSRGGYAQFIWSLSRCTPIPYVTSVEDKNEAIAKLLTVPPESTLCRLEVTHGGSSTSLSRPVYPFEQDSPFVPTDLLINVDIDKEGLKAVGFLAGYETIIFPAEYRGVSIRVRGVAIGDSGFLGAESLLTGAHKAALSQITGEINVLSGLDAIDTLNPGRESFYEESEHYKILRRHFMGEGERVGGYVGRAIAAVLRRSQVRSALTDALGRATLRRGALEDVSAAITHLIARGDSTASAIREMLKSKRSHVNGLASAQTLDLGVPPRIGGLEVVRVLGLLEPAVPDYNAEKIKLDTSRLEWEWSLLLFDRRFEVIPKKGQPDQPIAEMDLKKGEILVNWEHPVKLQMDERGFLRTALAWVLAKEAAQRDSELMMDLTLRLLSFTTVTDG